VKNITLSADQDLIEKAREVARSENKTLNAAFREWLESYAARQDAVAKFNALMERLKYVNAGRKFTRDEMNER
jgi:predicted transcriptional regulator